MSGLIAARADRPVDSRMTDVRATLSWYRCGAHDPTTWLTSIGRGATSAGDFVRATRTPDGPGTLHIRWSGRAASDGMFDTTSEVEGVAGISLATYGPGGDWLAHRAPAMLGVGDTGAHGLEASSNIVVARAARANRSLRIGASGDLYHELLPTIIEQRITSGEAHTQWGRLCRELSEPAPGPFTRLLLPPEPDVLARRPGWSFHPLGIERKRAEPLINVARHASKLWDWASSGPVVARQKLHLLGGVGQWTIGTVLGPALGDPDAVAVGDYHLKNMVGYTLAGEARATDERMIELLEPFRGQRGRLVRMLKYSGVAAPKFGPKKRILPMSTW